MGYLNYQFFLHFHIPLSDHFVDQHVFKILCELMGCLVEQIPIIDSLIRKIQSLRLYSLLIFNFKLFTNLFFLLLQFVFQQYPQFFNVFYSFLIIITIFQLLILSVLMLINLVYNNFYNQYLCLSFRLKDLYKVYASIQLMYLYSRNYKLKH